MSEYKSAVNEFCHKGDQGVGHFLEGDIDSRSCKNSFVCFFFFLDWKNYHVYMLIEVIQ